MEPNELEEEPGDEDHTGLPSVNTDSSIELGVELPDLHDTVANAEMLGE